MYLRDFLALKPFHDYSLCSVCILPQPAFYSQSAVCILHSVCILPLVRSLQSAVRSPQSAVRSPQSAVFVLHWPIVYSVFVCMQLRERILQNSEMADAKAIFNSAVETSLLELERLGMSRVLRNEKVKAISTLASGQDLLVVLNRYPTFTSCQNAACFNTFFYLAGRLCSWGFYVLTKQMWF